MRAHPPSPAHDLKGEFEGFFKEREAVKQRAYARVFSCGALLAFSGCILGASHLFFMQKGPHVEAPSHGQLTWCAPSPSCTHA